jgi:hypothetical protein
MTQDLFKDPAGDRGSTTCSPSGVLQADAPSVAVEAVHALVDAVAVAAPFAQSLTIALAWLKARLARVGNGK